MKRSAILVAGIAMLASGVAGASERDCRADFFRATVQMRAALVRNDGPRLHFVRNAEGRTDCPALTEACRERAYLVPGNGVIVGPEANGFRCAIYLATNGQSRAGWLPATGLILLPPALAPDWSGRWTAGPEQTITISHNESGAWVLEGEATYGARDPERVRRGGVNMGNFSATVAREEVEGGAFMSFTEGAETTLAFDKGEPGQCRVSLRLVGPWLVATDNGSCGGHNVSFSGIYRRAP
jgi:hypothetical protein